jgi:hypothetical protein
MCDRETPRMRWPWSALGCCARERETDRLTRRLGGSNLWRELNHESYTFQPIACHYSLRLKPGSTLIPFGSGKRFGLADWTENPGGWRQQKGKLLASSPPTSMGFLYSCSTEVSQSALGKGESLHYHSDARMSEVAEWQEVPIIKPGIELWPSIWRQTSARWLLKSLI